MTSSAPCVLLARGGRRGAWPPGPSRAGRDKDLNLWIGTMLHVPSKYPTFDFYIAAVGHALAPWSAFLPFAFGRLFLVADRAHRAARASARAWRASRCSSGPTVALVAHGYLAARTDLVAFSGPALVRRGVRRGHPRLRARRARVDRRRPGHAGPRGRPPPRLPRAAGEGVHGLRRHRGDVPGELQGHRRSTCGGSCSAASPCAPSSRGSSATPSADRSTRRPTPRSCGRCARPTTACSPSVYFATIAGASLAGLFVFVGMRTHAHWMPQMSSSIRDVVLNAWWVVAFVPLGAIFGLLFACDVWLLGVRAFPAAVEGLPDARLRALRGARRPACSRPTGTRSSSATRSWWSSRCWPSSCCCPCPGHHVPRVGRGTGLQGRVVARFWRCRRASRSSSSMGLRGRRRSVTARRGWRSGGAVVGFVLCFFYYPALANQLSPKEVFESYRHVCPGAPLALLGVGGRTAAYYAGRTAADAERSDERLQLARGGRLGPAPVPGHEGRGAAEAQPAVARAQSPGARTNLPVLDARSSQILLAASSLGPGREEREPALGRWSLTALPHPQRPLDVNMDDKLEVLGVDIARRAREAGRSDRPGQDLSPEDLLQGARARHDRSGKRSSTSTATTAATTATTSR